jgi:hypothetical protein
MSEITDKTPKFWLRDEEQNITVDTAITTYDQRDGSFAIKNLPPHKVGVSIGFHVTGEKATLPGNYEMWQVIDVPRLSHALRAKHDIQIQQIMHLQEPWDNNIVDTEMIPNADKGLYPTYDAPIKFAWAALKDATGYGMEINECHDNNSPNYKDGCDRCKPVVRSEALYTSFAFLLPPSQEHYHYELSLVAYNPSYGTIGKYMSTHKFAEGYDYRFKIRSRP